MNAQNQEQPVRGPGESRLAPAPPVPGTPPLMASPEQTLRAPPALPLPGRGAVGGGSPERALPSPALPRTLGPAAPPPPGVGAPMGSGGPPSALGGERKLPAAPAFRPATANEAPLAGPQVPRPGQLNSPAPASPTSIQSGPSAGPGATTYPGGYPVSHRTPYSGSDPGNYSAGAPTGYSAAYPAGYPTAAAPMPPGGMPNPGWGQPPANPPPVPPPNAGVQSQPPAAYPGSWAPPFAPAPTAAPAPVPVPARPAGDQVNERRQKIFLRKSREKSSLLVMVFLLGGLLFFGLVVLLLILSLVS